MYVAGALAGDDRAAADALFDLVRSNRPQPDDKIEIVNRVIAAIETDDDLQTVTAVAGAFGRSERWLQQLFRSYVGIGLKWLLLRQKLLAAAERIRDGENMNWADLAYELGYSSQQHFNTDFKRVLGKTPVQFWKQSGPR